MAGPGKPSAATSVRTGQKIPPKRQFFAPFKRMFLPRVNRTKMFHGPEYYDKPCGKTPSQADAWGIKIMLRTDANLSMPPGARDHHWLVSGRKHACQ
jgi:hypothetical protein